MNWKKTKNYFLYAVPFYGLIDQLKKSREERSTLGIVGLSLYTIPFVVKIGLGLAFLLSHNKDQETKDKIYPDKNMNPIENTQTIKKEGKLEKTILYKEAIKKFKN